MRIVSWNCNMAFREKKDKLLELDPDIAIVQECESPAARGTWEEFSAWEWVGDNEHNGLGVFSRNRGRIERLEGTESASRYTLPVRTDLPIDILGVWAMNDETEHRKRYIGQVYTALDDYSEFVDSETVVAGDFNWNVRWDTSPKYPLYGDFADVVAELHDKALQGAYHVSESCEFGNEDDPTFYMHKKRDRGYHIDYVFVPTVLADVHFDCWIGDYDEWIDLSGHMPVVVDTYLSV